MSDFPHVLEAEDYQSLLKLLTDFKPTIQHSLHMKCFISIANVMLRKEHELKKSSTLIMVSFCTEHWHKIMEMSFKQAETDKTQLENVILMRVLIDHKVFVSHDFVKNIITAIAKTQTIKKSNNSIELLISVLRNVNTDMIEGIKDLKIAIIQWLSSKVKLSELKKVIENNNTLDKHLVAELYVRCVLSRHEEDISTKSYRPAIETVENDFDVQEHDLLIADIVQNLQYRMLSKLVVSDTIEHTDNREASTIHELPERNAVKACVDELLNNELEKAIHDSDSSNDHSIENFNSICTSLATNVSILNCRVGFESINGEDFLKDLTKKVFFKISQLSSIVANLSASFNVDRNANDVNEVVDNLLGIWHENYHAIVAENLFIVANSTSIIKWLQAQLRPSNRSLSISLSPIKEIAQLEFEERIQLKCLTLLAHFSMYQGDDEGSFQVFEAIENYRFSYKRNADLFIIFQLIKVIHLIFKMYFTLNMKKKPF